VVDGSAGRRENFAKLVGGLGLDDVKNAGDSGAKHDADGERGTSPIEWYRTHAC